MIKSRPLFYLILLLVAYCLFTLPAGAQQEETKEIIATGMGGGAPAKARDDAINDALRRAVEQGMGTYISSETLVEQMMLVEDKIYSRTSGYIQDYKILSEKRDSDLYSVTISATVKMTRLADDLKAIGLLIRKKSNPRVMVIVRSTEESGTYFNIASEGNRNAQNHIESMLLAKGFRLVDPSLVQRKKELEMLLAGNNPAAAADIAVDYGAEILIEADVRRDFAGNRSILGRPAKFFSNDLRLKAIETDTGKIMYSGYETRPASGASSLQQLEEATAKLTDEMIRGILDQWRKDVYQAATFQIQLSGISFTELSKIIQGLEELRGVGNIRTRSFQNRQALLELNFQGTLNDLAGRIAKIEKPRLEVVGLQSNTIDVKPFRE